MSEQTREAAMKVLQEFLQNYNRLVEFVFISILLALSRTDRYKLFWTLDQIATIGTVDAKEVLKVYRIELCMAVNYLDNFLREVGMKMIPHEDDNQGNELK